MPNAHNKTVDTTFLSIDTAEERNLIHRDYIAHSFRWSHVARLLGRSGRYKTTRLLDIGCGKEVPLGKLLYSNRFIPEAYCGVDVRSDLVWPDMLSAGVNSNKLRNWKLVTGDCATISETEIGFKPNFVTAFEIVEHVEADHRVGILKHIREIIDSNGTFILSTPNYCHRTGAADNHVDETTHCCLGAMIEDCGWQIKARYGTFASISDYKDQFFADYGAAAELIFGRLHEYYDTNVLSTIFAPLYPELSRNICWELTPSNADNPHPRVYQTMAETISACPREPDGTVVWQKWLGSSEKWNDEAYRNRIVEMIAQ